MTKITLGILGGGQLAMLSCLAARDLDINVIIYCDAADSPAFSVCQKYFCNDYDDVKALAEFADMVDFVSYEFENIPETALQILAEKKELYPNPDILKISQNRLTEKSFINDLGIATAAFYPINSLASLQQHATDFAFKAILKTTELGYDGKGQYKINEAVDLAQIWSLIEQGKQEMILEQKVDFIKEVSVIVARSIDGEIKTLPLAENIHEDGVLRTTIVPANISTKAAEEANNIAIKIATALDLVGVLAVEMFVLEGDVILVNEIAPRPHNSGHYSIDACNYSQFAQFVLAVTKQKLKDVVLERQVVMYNLLGDEILQEEELTKQANVKFYNYGKKEIKAGRKMGHYTITKPLKG